MEWDITLIFYNSVFYFNQKEAKHPTSARVHYTVQAVASGYCQTEDPCVPPPGTEVSIK